MRHYEIVVLVHPDQSDRIDDITARYRGVVEQAGGTIDRLEDWGRRQLAYTIKKAHKAHYLLLNVTCDQQTHDKLVELFRFSDAVLRHLVIRTEQPVTEPSVMVRQKED